MQLLNTLLPAFVAGVAALLGIFGDTWNTKARRLTRLGWCALVLASAGLVLGVQAAHSAYRESERRKVQAYDELSEYAHLVGKATEGYVTVGATFGGTAGPARLAAFAVGNYCQRLAETTSRHQGELEPEDTRLAVGLEDWCDGEREWDVLGSKEPDSLEVVVAIQLRLRELRSALELAARLCASAPRSSACKERSALLSDLSESRDNLKERCAGDFRNARACAYGDTLAAVMAHDSILVK